MKLQKIFLTLLFLTTIIGNTFAQNDTITTVINPWVGGTLSGSGVYPTGSAVELTAFPNSNYKFVNWMENNNVLSVDSIYSFFSNGNRTIYGNFELKNYVISASISPNLSGSVYGEGAYQHGESVNLEAIPNIGYEFISWTDNGIIVSSDSLYAFSATENRNLTANFALKKIVISSNINPINSGIITGTGIFDYGTAVKLEAIPNPNFDFVNWTKNENIISTDSIYEFTAESNLNLTANFVLKSFAVASQANPVEGGIITGDGIYIFGTNVNIIASPAPGFSFINWTENNVVVSSDTSYSFIIEANRNLVANFSLNQYLISAVSLPVSGGITTGSGLYDHGQNVELIATPAYGYNFVNWLENDLVISSDSVYSFIAANSMNITAVFEKKKYTVTTQINPIGSGEVIGDSLYDHGSMVNLQAKPKIGWLFNKWTENGIAVSIDSNYNFVILNNKYLTANFSKKIYSITVNSFPIDGGVTIGSGNYEHDSIVVLVATPNTGWNFINWTTGGNIVSTDSIFTFSANKSLTLTAHYEKKIFTIETLPMPEIGGLTIGDSLYTFGDQVTLKALPDTNSGYEFLSWTEDGDTISKNANYSFTSNNDRKLIANFSLRKYKVELNSNPQDAGIVSGTNIYTHGDSVTITATPNNGWLFANWTDGTNNLSSSESFTFEINSRKTLTANFAHELYTLNSTAEPSESGIISGSGSFYYGQIASLTPVANIGWEFESWTKNGHVISTDSILTIQIEENLNIKAQFKLKSYSIICSSYPMEAGFTSGSGFYYYNQQMTLEAIANDGWKFKHWTENGEIISELPKLELDVDGSRNLVANFDLISDVNFNEGLNNIPDNYYLSNAYPNPFNPSTKVNFGLPESSVVKILISNINGQIVKTILLDANLPAGNYFTNFDAENLSSGVYLYIILAHSKESDQTFKKVQKLLLIK